MEKALRRWRRGGWEKAEEGDGGTHLAEEKQARILKSNMRGNGKEGS